MIEYCPWCHEVWDTNHSVIVMKGVKMISCPKYPKNENPIILNSAIIKQEKK